VRCLSARLLEHAASVDRAGPRWFLGRGLPVAGTRGRGERADLPSATASGDWTGPRPPLGAALATEQAQGVHVVLGPTITCSAARGGRGFEAFSETAADRRLATAYVVVQDTVGAAQGLRRQRLRDRAIHRSSSRHARCRCTGVRAVVVEAGGLAGDSGTTGRHHHDRCTLLPRAAVHAVFRRVVVSDWTAVRDTERPRGPPGLAICRPAAVGEHWSPPWPRAGAERARRRRRWAAAAAGARSGLEVPRGGAVPPTSTGGRGAGGRFVRVWCCCTTAWCQWPPAGRRCGDGEHAGAARPGGRQRRATERVPSTRRAAPAERAEGHLEPASAADGLRRCRWPALTDPDPGSRSAGPVLARGRSAQRDGAPRAGLVGVPAGRRRWSCARRYGATPGRLRGS